MIKPVTMYSVICDRCGKPFIDEFNGIAAWLDEGTAKEQAMESEWTEIGDKHLAIPKGDIPSDKQKCQPKTQHEFTIKGVKIMAASKKDAIKKFNHRKK